MKKRFAKLAALTRGAAVISLSAGAGAGCTKSDPASPAPVAAASVSPSEPADADLDGGIAMLRRRRFPIPNAMHPGWRRRDGGDGPGEGGTDGGP